MFKTSTNQKTLNNLHEFHDVTPTLQYDAGPEGCVRLWWSELSAPPNAKAVYVIDYWKKKEKGRRFRRISNGSSVRLPEIKCSAAIKEYNITVTGHLEFAEIPKDEECRSSEKTSKTFSGTLGGYVSSISNFLSFGEGPSSPDDCVQAYLKVFGRLPADHHGEKYSAIMKMMEVLRNQISQLRSVEYSYQSLLSENAKLQAKVEKLQGDLNRERGQKLHQAKLAGNLQDPGERTDLETGIEQYFSSQLNAFVNMFGDGAKRVQIVVAKLFCETLEYAAEGMALSVSKFAEENNFQANVVKARKKLDAEKDSKIDRLVYAFHCGATYGNRDDFSVDEWNLFNCIMSLKAHFLSKNKEYPQMLAKMAQKRFLEALQSRIEPHQPCNYEEFATKSAELIVEMLMSSNPVVTWMELKTFDERYTTLQVRQSHKITKMHGDKANVDGWPIEYYLQPILLTAVHSKVHVFLHGQVIVEMK